MTRQEQINLLSPGYAEKFTDDYADANNMVCDLCEPGIVKDINNGMSDIAFRRLFQAFAEQVTSIELMAAAIGKADEFERLKTKIYDDEIQFKRWRMQCDSGGFMVRCDHCNYYRPVGDTPVGGCCVVDPMCKRMVSADSFCPQIMPTRKRVKKTEVTYV